MTKTLIAIVGPTAIGKTSLSIKLANHFNTEIISADSRQFYKEMSIGTAAPSATELQATKHHFIHHKSIHDAYNVGEFEKDSLTLLEELFKTHNTMIMVGGSGLYVDAVLNGLDDFPDVDKSIREALMQQLESKGLLALQLQLKELDTAAYSNIDIYNPHRLIRALEICIGTKKPYSSFLGQKQKKRNFNSICIGLTADRELIYNRINERVDVMIETGLIEEAKTLYKYRSLNALNTVGYKELFAHFDDENDLETAISEIKKNTRRFAKRQLTWYRKKPSIKWFQYDSDITSIVDYIERNLK